MYITLPHLKKQEKIKLFIISFFLHTRFLSLVLDEVLWVEPGRRLLIFVIPAGITNISVLPVALDPV